MVTGEEFGARLKQLRIEAGLSQEQLAERAGISVGAVGSYERGLRRAPHRDTLAFLAEALGISGKAYDELAGAADRGRQRKPNTSALHWAQETLPLALTALVGREAELEELATLMRGCRLVTLAGAGGIGKTCMALQVAKAFAAAEAISACFVRFAQVSDPSLVLQTIVQSLGVKEGPNRPVLDTLLASLKIRALLLILDNCEHVLEQVALAAEALLSRCPRVHILATSREPLRAAGEQVYRLSSLSEKHAILLFADRARAANAGFDLSEENERFVGAICRRLSGIPLAIELAAARVTVLSLAELAAALEDPLRILVGGKRTAPPRQRTLRAAIDWSYDLLSGSERRVFERLSILEGTCTLAMATNACGSNDLATTDVIDLVSALVSKSLVVADHHNAFTRYSLLEPIRRYAYEKFSSALR